MTAAAIDLETLNELFDNQKKLDDVFDSIFDEDFSIGSPVSLNEHAIGFGGQEDGDDLYSSEDLSFDVEEKTKRSVTYFVMPVIVEISIIYYSIMYFT